MRSCKKNRIGFAVVWVAILVWVGAGERPLVAQSVAPAATIGPTAEAQLLWSGITLMEKQLEREFSVKQDLEAKVRELEAQRLAMQEKQSDSGVSAESFPEIMKVLQTQRVDLMIDLAGLKARRAAMIEYQKTTIATASDLTFDSLRKMLMLNNRNLELAKDRVASGEASQGSVIEIELKVLNVELQIAQATQARNQAQLGPEMLAISLDTAEKEARLEKTNALLESFEATRRMVDSSRMAEQELHAVKATQSQVKQRITMLEQHLEQARANFELVRSGDQE